MAQAGEETPADLAALVLAAEDGVVSEAAIAAVLSERLAHSHPYTWASATTLVSVNPYRDQSGMDAEAAEHASVYHDLTAVAPHPCALAARAYHRMLRTQQSQSIVYHGMTDAGKTHTMQLVTEHLLTLASSNTPQEAHLADQVRCAQHVLGAFGTARTSFSERSSRHATYLELHFGPEGRMCGAKLLTFGLDQHRLHDKAPGERVYAIFYQLLAGATHDEQVAYHLSELTAPAMLPPGTSPSREDARACDWTRSALAALGLKEKHVQGLFRVLAALLHLSDVDFGEPPTDGQAAHITTQRALERAADVLQVRAEDLAQCLVMDTRYLGNERVTQMLNVRAARRQRDALVENLYAVLFAFVVEVVNQKLAPHQATHPLHIVQLDTPGFVTRAEAGLPRAGHFDDLMKNYVAELLRHVDLRSVLDESAPRNAQLRADGLSVPPSGKYADVMSLLRGGPVPLDADAPAPGGLMGDYDRAFHLVLDGIRKESDDRALVSDLDAYCTNRAFSPSDPRRGTLSFDINHTLGPCAYTVTQHQRSELDLLPTQQYQLLRTSGSTFITRLFAGPGMTIESHLADHQVVLRAQVATHPLRRPTPLDGRTVHWDAGRVQSVSQQLDTALLALAHNVQSADTCWRIVCMRPNDLSQPNAFDTKRVTRQIKALALPQLLRRLQYSHLAPVSFEAFCARYNPVLHATLGDTVMAAADARGVLLEFAYAQGWTEPNEMVLGNTQVCFSYVAYFTLEDMLRHATGERSVGAAALAAAPKRTTLGASRQDALPRYSAYSSASGTQPSSQAHGSDPLSHTYVEPGYSDVHGSATYEAGYAPMDLQANGSEVSLLPGDEKPLPQEPTYPPDAVPLTSWAPAPGEVAYEKDGLLAPTGVESVPTTRLRRWWMRLTWALTWYIPSSVLSNVGGMKRPDVRMAWREKLTICLLIFFLCAAVLFYIIGIGQLLCPDYNKAYNEGQLGGHSTSKSFYVAVAGKVYDITKFYKMDHSDLSAMPVTTDVMMKLAGQDLTPYFPVPLSVGCPGLVTDDTLQLSTNENLTATIGQAIHTSGAAQTYQNTKLDSPSWYFQRFLPKMQQYYKGIYVYDPKQIANDGSWRKWATVNGKLYDLTNYLYTINLHSGDDAYSFLDSDVTDLFDAQAGGDISHDYANVLNGMPSEQRTQTQQCLDNVFYVGKSDFRLTAKCETQNYILLSFSVLIFLTIFSKFVSALQLVRKPTPEQQDRFVICHIPCYTEGEDSLRKTIDSLTTQEYDDKRKLLFIVCDGMITGSGNDRPTPRIVLDILGVDSKVDPEPLPFHSVAEGSKQLNYAKVYSGLYECEGNVVPYVVVVKVGRPSERSRPGNRGKRDTQVMLMRYLNRVHFDEPMSPLELELYHHMKNVIGIDPSFYEYILMVDADTGIKADGMNRLVAAAVHDHSIIAVCGETLLENEEASWWTMVQVYEYYISHNLAKAFESLFGSVTCLPGCFSMYRIRSADKGQPLFISNRIIDDYAENQVDTLHKKNLFALGEDRYLTTLLLKHFPSYRTRFRSDASATTVAPEKFSVLLSQRRRWINSTVHNLVELVMMDGLCGFCLVRRVPTDSVLDALYRVHRPARHHPLARDRRVHAVSHHHGRDGRVGAAVHCARDDRRRVRSAGHHLPAKAPVAVHWVDGHLRTLPLHLPQLLAYPLYSFLLPIYSFWHMDDFSWGNTRVVVGEKGNMKVVAGTDDEPFDESMIPRKRFSEYQQEIAESGEAQHTVPLYAPSRATRTMTPDPEYTDYFQHTNLLSKKPRESHASTPMPRASMPSTYAMPPSQTTSMYGMPMGMPPMMSMYGMPPAMSMYGMPMGMPPTMSMYGMPPAPFATPGTGERPWSGAPTDASVLPVVTTTDPSDQELRAAVQTFLAAQPSLMHITKRDVREALSASMPNADLGKRRTQINMMIDELLSGN